MSPTNQYNEHFAIRVLVSYMLKAPDATYANKSSGNFPAVVIDNQRINPTPPPALSSDSGSAPRPAHA